ncbi:MAG TPA: amino acid ABC transporter permease [Candidatus Anaerotruncus excrementipullorum]|uniref:Amino acid ABC transporter permease n=1 Tax=Candidatus Anaerotruncus excrementipullorum TaxID=2838465 RepID=A0A9D1WR93_9FIRM|nr:amino acid ABC transporter permease [Candidatus Anaerotruncus excrementipullorum]
MFASAAQIAVKYWPMFWAGIKVTLLIALTGTILGLLIGLVVGSIRAVTSKKEPRDSMAARVVKKLVYFLTSVYVEFFRGTPMIVQGVFFFYGLKPYFDWTPTVAGIFVISINTGAYMAEILRSGIQSVDVGQTEAARSIGMTPGQTMLHVVLPQAIKNAFPAIGNEFVVNIKDSSVLNAISLTELYFQSMKIAGTIFDFTSTMLVTSLIYLVLTFTTTRILRLIEIRLNQAPSSFPASQTVPEASITITQKKGVG